MISIGFVRRKMLFLCASVVITAAFFFAVYTYSGHECLRFEVIMDSPQPDIGQVFWDVGPGFTEKNSKNFEVKKGIHRYEVQIPLLIDSLRFDPCTRPANILIEELSININLIFVHKKWNGTNRFTGWSAAKDIVIREVDDHGLSIISTGGDAQLVNVIELRKRIIKYLIYIAVPLIFITIGILMVLFNKIKISGDMKIKLALLLSSIIISLVIFSVFYKIYSANRKAHGQVHEPAAYSLGYYTQNGKSISREPGNLKLMLDPLMLYVNFPNQRASNLTINSNGFRGEELRNNKPKAVIVGGSTAFGMSLTGDNKTLSAQLSEMNDTYEFINAGVVGYLSGQELSLIVHRLSDLQPKVYIIFDGWNDYFDQYRSMKRKLDTLLGGANGPVFVDIQQRLEAMSSLEKQKENIGIIKDMPVRYNDYTNNDRLYLGRLLSHYAGNLNKMHSFAKATDSCVLVFFQPELGSKQYKTKEEQTIVKNWAEMWDVSDSQNYTSFLNDAGQYCEKHNIHCINLNSNPVFTDNKNTLYYDMVHINELGHKLAAQTINESLSLCR
ncbi:MAG: SGNH/GDSL hydrolase family protein [Nitrospirae bacterium]|nr:SGNH/GDSL hydrolase family protein [Nitrospirota bacterium]